MQSQTRTCSAENSWSTSWPAHLIDHLSACPSERHLISARASPQETVRRLFCLLCRFWFLVVFGVTNQGVACWWQVLFSTTHFGCCVRAELQIVLLRPLSNFNHLFCQSASSKICSSDARFSTDSRRPCFVMPKFCSKCGNRVCPEAKFCGECGKRLVCAVPQRQHGSAALADQLWHSSGRGRLRAAQSQQQHAPPSFVNANC